MVVLPKQWQSSKCLQSRGNSSALLLAHACRNQNVRVVHTTPAALRQLAGRCACRVLQLWRDTCQLALSRTGLALSRGRFAGRLCVSLASTCAQTCLHPHPVHAVPFHPHPANFVLSNNPHLLTRAHPLKKKKRHRPSILCILHYHGRYYQVLLCFFLP